MNHKEQAEKLVNKYMAILLGRPIWNNYPVPNKDFTNAKKCAIIAVDLVMEHLLGTENCFNNGKPVGDYENWLKVKLQIEKL